MIVSKGLILVPDTSRGIVSTGKTKILGFDQNVFVKMLKKCPKQEGTPILCAGEIKAGICEQTFWSPYTIKTHIIDRECATSRHKILL